VRNGLFARRLQAIWYSSDKPPWLLRLFAVGFAMIVRMRRAAYARGWRRAWRSPKPVIVVGNLTVGGSGKTPLVIWLVQQLRARGLQPGIVLRGYGGTAARRRLPSVVEPDSDVTVVGDEALLLRQRTSAPVVVGRDRVRAAQRLLQSSVDVDVILSDDGLQHLRLGRDFEIAVIDAARRLGNGALLPAGPLREPRERLTQVDAVVFNGDGVSGRKSPRDLTAVSAFDMRVSGEWLLPLGGSGKPRALSSLSGARVHAVAGIGNPQRFFDQLSEAGLQVVPHPFPDHHRFDASELEFEEPLPVLMTEKDAVKCRAFAATNRWYLPVAASFSEADGSLLIARLQRCLMS
jgi:tetraacyldisaccharide 4'-kinase